MKLERTKNAKRNIIWGLVNKIVKIILPFIIRTIIIYRLGEEYIGLNSLFTSILSTLSLAELGFDTAIVAIMYRYVAEENNLVINALVNFIRKAYLVVGCTILILGCLCIPFLKYMIKDYQLLPVDINIYIIYLLFLFNTVISYFFGGYRTCIFEAYQRQDIISNLNSIITIVFSAFQIITLILFRNYYLYLGLSLISNLVLNILIYSYSKKHYQSIKAEGYITLSQKKELKKILYGTFMGKIGGVLSTSADNIVISSFLGVTILAYYTNYYYIVTALQSVLVTIYISLQAGIGNSIALDTKEKNYDDMMKFTFMFNWIVGWCSICMMVLFQPFIDLWVGKEAILPYIVQLFIVLDFYIVMCGSIQGTYKNALAIWWEDRYRCIVSGLVNISLNITFVLFLRRLGNIYALIGIVFSTVIADLLVSTPWSIKVTFNVYFKHGAKKYVYSLLTYFFVTCVNYVITIGVSKVLWILDIPFILKFLLNCVVCIIIPNVIYFMFYFKTKQFKLAKNFLLSGIRK